MAAFVPYLGEENVDLFDVMNRAADRRLEGQCEVPCADFLEPHFRHDSVWRGDHSWQATHRGPQSSSVCSRGCRSRLTRKPGPRNRSASSPPTSRAAPT